jgi:glycosyltransferase involved in cell wall biosynthesis
MSATEVVACSQSVSDLFVAHNVTLVPPTLLGYGGTKGVDAARFRMMGEAHAFQYDIGFVGRLAGDKGADQLLEVFTRILAQLPESQLGLAGGFDTADPIDPTTRIRLTESPNVTLLGHTSDVPEFLSDVRVLCFPSKREGLPNAIIEAAACGVPTVAWLVTGCADAVIDGVTGFLVPYGDIEQMTRRVHDLIVNDELRAKMSKAAATFAYDRFDSRLVEMQYTDFYRALISRDAGCR